MQMRTKLKLKTMYAVEFAATFIATLFGAALVGGILSFVFGSPNIITAGLSFLSMYPVIKWWRRRRAWYISQQQTKTYEQ